MSVELSKTDRLAREVFQINTADDFSRLALEVFRFQYDQNTVYRSFSDSLGRNPYNVKTIANIPFLPISFFKTHPIRSGAFIPEAVFESSGTTGSATSRHEVKSLALYEASFLKGFERFYGDPRQYRFLGLLPSYLERSQSSLVYMVKVLMEQSGYPENAFYLQNTADLAAVLARLESDAKPTLLIGVTYALLEFARQYPQALRSTIVMETGGMKGRQRELTRTEVHQTLKEAFSVPAIHSEYGMTELLSQAYAVKDGVFQTPPWMQLLLREEDDPLQLLPADKQEGTGAVNVIDLANIGSCSFIATEDVGRQKEGGGFELLGRLDNSDIRGCSLLAL